MIRGIGRRPAAEEVPTEERSHFSDIDGSTDPYPYYEQDIPFFEGVYKCIVNKSRAQEWFTKTLKGEQGAVGAIAAREIEAAIASPKRRSRIGWIRELRLYRKMKGTSVPAPAFTHSIEFPLYAVDFKSDFDEGKVYSDVRELGERSIDLERQPDDPSKHAEDLSWFKLSEQGDAERPPAQGKTKADDKADERVAVFAWNMLFDAVDPRFRQKFFNKEYAELIDGYRNWWRERDDARKYQASTCYLPLPLPADGSKIERSEL